MGFFFIKKELEATKRKLSTPSFVMQTTLLGHAKVNEHDKVVFFENVTKAFKSLSSKFVDLTESQLLLLI